LGIASGGNSSQACHFNADLSESEDLKLGSAVSSDEKIKASPMSFDDARGTAARGKAKENVPIMSKLKLNLAGVLTDKGLAVKPPNTIPLSARNAEPCKERMTLTNVTPATARNTVVSSIMNKLGFQNAPLAGGIASARNTMVSSFQSSLNNFGFEGGSELQNFSHSNTKGDNFKKRMSIMNNDHLSQREQLDIKDQLRNVKEVIDPSKDGAVFEIKNQAAY